DVYRRRPAPSGGVRRQGLRVETGEGHAHRLTVEEAIREACRQPVCSEPTGRGARANRLEGAPGVAGSANGVPGGRARASPQGGVPPALARRTPLRSAKRKSVGRPQLCPKAMCRLHLRREKSRSAKLRASLGRPAGAAP